MYDSKNGTARKMSEKCADKGNITFKHAYESFHSLYPSSNSQHRIKVSLKINKKKKTYRDNNILLAASL